MWINQQTKKMFPFMREWDMISFCLKKLENVHCSWNQFAPMGCVSVKEPVTVTSEGIWWVNEGGNCWISFSHTRATQSACVVINSMRHKHVEVCDHISPLPCVTKSCAHIYRFPHFSVRLCRPLSACEAWCVSVVCLCASVPGEHLFLHLSQGCNNCFTHQHTTGNQFTLN